MKRLYSLLALLLVANTVSFSQTFDESFAAKLFADASSTNGIILDDGKYILVGEFVSANGQALGGIARFNSDGSIDNTFNIGNGATGQVLAVASQADGKLILVGRFTKFNDQTVNSFIRLNEDGSIDNTFNPNVVFNNGGVTFNAKVLASGKIMITGSITDIDGSQYFSYMARFNADGSRDNSFTGPDTNGSIFDFDELPNGKIAISGVFSTVNDISMPYAALLNTDGSVDTGFSIGTGFNNAPQAVRALSNNRIVFGGSFTSFNGTNVTGVLAVTATGVIDASYEGNGTTASVVTLEKLADGKLIIGGGFSSVAGNNSYRIARLNDDGSFDNTFAIGIGSDAFVNNVSVNASGTVLCMSDYLTSFNGQPRNKVAVLGDNGAVLSQTAPLTLFKNARVSDVAVQSDGKILVVFEGTHANTTATGNMVRFNTDGTVDNTFSASTNNSIETVEVLSSGKILIGGNFTTANSATVSRMCQLNEDGSLDAAFNTAIGTATNASVRTFLEQADGKIIVGGTFSTFNGNNYKGLVRLHADGTVDGSFNTTNGFSTNTTAYINRIKVMNDGSLLVGGQFDSFNGNTAVALVRLTSAGDYDNTFSTGTGFTQSGQSAYVNDMVELENGQLMVGGYFEKVNNQTMNYMARLNADGSLDNSFPAYNGYFIVEEFAMQKDWQVLVVDRNKLFSRLTKEGNADTEFPSIVFNSSTYDIDTVDNNVYVTGWFSAVNSTSAISIARFTLPEAPASPTELAAIAESQHVVALTWVDNATSESNYVVERSVGTNTNFQLLATLPANTTSYNDNSVQPETTYYYRVYSKNAGFHSSYSNEASATTPVRLPEAPTTLSITIPSETELMLSWTDASDNEAGFSIERSVDNNTSFEAIDTVTVNQFTDVGLTEGTRYFYRVRSFNEGGASIYSNEVSAIPVPATPIAPVSLSAQAVAQPASVILSWNDVVTNETGFEIERSVGDASSFEAIDTTTFNADEYTDHAVENGVTYYYRIKALNNLLFSPYTSIVSAYVAHPAPPAPTAFQVEELSASSLRLTWADESDLETNFIITRSTTLATGPYDTLAVLPANTTQYDDTGLTPGILHFYRLSAANSDASSNTVELSKIPGLFIMSNDDISTCEGVFLDPGGYGLYPSNSTHTSTITSDTPGQTLQVSFLNFDTENFWHTLSIYDGPDVTSPLIGTYSGTNSPGVIRSSNEEGALTFKFVTNSFAGKSGWHATLACLSIPLKPLNVHAEVINTSQVTLAWTDQATDEVGYIVERSNNITGPFSQVASLPANTSSFNDNTVVTDVTYYYRVKAKGEEHDSPYDDLAAIRFGEGVWKLKKQFSSTARTDAFGFSVDGRGYIGTGWAGAQTANVASYQPETNSWTAVQGFGGSIRAEATSFVIGDKAYAGTGEGFDLESDLWEYDPTENTWTEKTGFGGSARRGAVGFSIDGNGYIGLGTDGALKNDVWQYDPVGNEWQQVADFPGTARRHAVAFAIGDHAYVGTGYDGTYKNDFWKYNATTDTWSAIASLPGAARRTAVAFVIDGKGYVGTGEGTNDLADLWEYTPATDSWRRVVDFGGTARFAATAFAIDGKGYIGTGFDGSNRNDFWEFTPGTQPAAPTAPSNLQAQALSNTSVQLSWTPGSEGEVQIERALSSSQTFIIIASVEGTTHTDTALEPSTSYTYRVKLITAENGNSPYSNSASISTLPNPPASPTNLEGTALDHNSVQLTWVDAADTETGFTVERKASGGNYEELITLNQNATTHTDNTAEPDTEYTYRVVAYNTGGNSEYSNEVIIATPEPALTAPGSLVATAISMSSISLTWNDLSSIETGFAIERSLEEAGPYSLIQIVDENMETYTETGLLENTTYYFRIKTVYDDFSSSYSEVVSAKTHMLPPAAPSNLQLNFNEERTAVTLTWVDNSENESGFVIERSFNGTTFTVQETVTTNIFTDSSFGDENELYYKVKAINEGGSSGYTPIASVIVTSSPESRTLVAHAYPNPFAESFYLPASTPGASVTLFDSSGKMIASSVSETETGLQITPAMNHTGIVLLRIESVGTVRWQKLLKN